MRNEKELLRFFALVLGIAVVSVFSANAAGNPSLVTMDTEYNVVSSIDTGSAYLNKHYVNAGNLTPIIMTFVNNDGSVSVCSVNTGTQETYVYEYTKDLTYTKTLRLRNEYNKFGAFTKDSQGNYYVFSAKDVAENEKNVDSMALVKYDRSGKILNTYRLKAYADNSFNGVKIPFSTGSCRMEISGNMLCVYFARQMFMSANDGLNHQASYGFIVDKENFRRIDPGQVSNSGFVINGMKMPYVSHSFNQFIFPIDNGFAFIDQGDAYPRGFAFARMLNGQSTKSVSSFVFKKEATYQNTFAQLGGLAKTSKGYIFAGTYEKNAIVSSSHNDSRNLFILTFDDNFTACSQPVWITNYNNKDTDNAASPKITELDEGRYLLMWERMSRSRHEGTYAAVIDENGKLLTSIDQLGSVRLNINDVLRFNRTTRSVCWAVNGGPRTINIYAYNLDHLIKIDTSGKKTSARATPPSQPSRPTQPSQPSRPSQPSKPSRPSGSRSSPTHLSFTGSFGMYLNGWHENILSVGIPLQLGVEVGFNNMAFDLLGEAGVGIGVLSFDEKKSPLLEWNFGGMGEFYFPGKKIGLGFGGGVVDSTVLNIFDLPPSEAFKASYLRYALIFRTNSKLSLYGQQYGNGNWGFGLQWGRAWR